MINASEMLADLEETIVPDSQAEEAAPLLVIGIVVYIVWG